MALDNRNCTTVTTPKQEHDNTIAIKHAIFYAQAWNFTGHLNILCTLLMQNWDVFHEE